MTSTQEAHLAQIQHDVNKLLDTKYRRGQAEHGGNLWERPALPELGQELIDALCYFLCAKQSMEAIHSNVIYAKELLSKGDYTRLEETLDVIFRLSHVEILAATL